MVVLEADVNGHPSMTDAEIQLLIAQARSEANNPAFKVCWGATLLWLAVLSQLIGFFQKARCVEGVANPRRNANRLTFQCKDSFLFRTLQRNRFKDADTAGQLRLYRSETGRQQAS